MLSRIDGVNNYLMYSDSVTQWDDPVLLQEPRYSWEFTQIGNCGSPIWTAEGWLVITWCRSYETLLHRCVLFDLDDPSKEIGRLKEPHFLHEDEREGYVPNVVYSVRLFTTTA
jgi:predicted GH43/DUF377 family glycosyl hydrolase